MNENWKRNLFDVEIEVVLDPELVYEEIQSTPQANAVLNKTVVWKVMNLDFAFLSFSFFFFRFA